MTLQEFALNLVNCEVKIEVVANRHRMCYPNDDALYEAIKRDHALANTTVVYFTIETDCLNIRIF